MGSCQYLRPETLSEAIALLERFGAAARPFLGGTDLLVRLQKGQQELDAVVDLKRIQDIGDSIELEPGRVTVGARVVLADLVRDERIREHFPALVEAASIVGSIQVRNRATLAGNICNGSPAADTVPALMVYGAEVTVVGSGGSRQVPLEQFFLGPGRTVCSTTEVVVEVRVPILPPPCGSAFGRITRRRGVDLATINVACAIDAGGVATFVFGAAGPTAVIAREQSGSLARPELDEGQREKLLQSLVQQTSPISDVRAGKEYRQAMLLTISRRVLEQAQKRRAG